MTTRNKRRIKALLSEHNRKRQQEAIAYYRSLNDEEKENYIRSRKKESREKYSAIKQSIHSKNKLKKEELRRGWEFYVNEHKIVKSVRVFKGKVADSINDNIVVVCRLVTGDKGLYYDVAYTMCSTQDVFKLRKGIALASYRLITIGSQQKHQYTNRIHLSKHGSISDNRLRHLISTLIRVDISTERVRMPVNYRAVCFDSNPNYIVDLELVNPLG